MTLRLIPFVAAALMLMALAQSVPGAPIPGILVGLEPQSGGQVLTATTAGSNAEAAINVPPGIYSVFVANGSSLPRPAMMTVIEGTQQRTSAVIAPTAGRVYVLGPNGPGRMMINTAQNHLVRLRLSSAQPPLCLSLPNGQPRMITAQGTATGTANTALNQATAAARAEWSRLARGYNSPGQPDYGDWNVAGRKNTSSSIRNGFPPATVVTLVGQPCRPG